jgi:hypothetical protein
VATSCSAASAGIIVGKLAPVDKIRRHLDALRVDATMAPRSDRAVVKQAPRGRIWFTAC